MKLTTVYFSATYTTRKVVEYLASSLTDEVTVMDITNEKSLEGVNIPCNECLLVGMPVYAGRIPAMAVEQVRRLKGEGTPAIAVAVYGNRDYDDALLELSDLLAENGFKVIAAGAFIAQHSIFPKVGAGRPDADDFQKMDAFVKEIQKLFSVESNQLLPIHVPGNRPYKIPGSIPIYPSGTKTCQECGKCARLCPVGAIPLDAPKTVDESRCIKCGRCIVVCPTQSRKFQGLKYKLASLKFNQAYQARKEPECFFARY